MGACKISLGFHQTCAILKTIIQTLRNHKLRVRGQPFLAQHYGGYKECLDAASIFLMNLQVKHILCSAYWFLEFASHRRYSPANSACYYIKVTPLNEKNLKILSDISTYRCSILASLSVFSFFIFKKKTTLLFRMHFIKDRKHK